MSRLGKRIFWLIFLILVGALITVIYIIPGADDLLKMTSVVEYGQIVKETEVTAWIVRDETVYTADASGTIQYFFEEGERVRKNSVLCSIVQNGRSIKAEAAGIVCYSIDGGEGILTPETMTTIKKAEVESFTESETAGKAGNVFAGQTLLKLVDEDKWYLLFWVEPEDAPNFSKGNSVDVTFQTGETLPGKVDELAEEADGWRVVVSLSRYYEDFASVRKQKVSVTTSDNTGLLVRNTAIGIEQNMTGVYVKQVNGEFAFVPVQVLATDGFYSVCAEGTFKRTTSEGAIVTQTTINAYDEILNVSDKKRQ